MNREILFRGRRTDNGEWVEGYYSELTSPSLGLAFLSGGEGTEAEDTVPCIINHRTKQSAYHDPGNPVCVVEQEIHEVNPATVGQYTGLNDKNGKRIFEGDVIKLPRDVLAEVVWVDEYDQNGHVQNCGYAIEFLPNQPTANHWRNDILFWVYDMDEDRIKTGSVGVEVIGTIHDKEAPHDRTTD